MSPHETELPGSDETLGQAQDQPGHPVIKIGARSKASAVAGVIARRFRETPCMEVHAIGISAVNQAVKAVAIAQNYLTNEGLPICIVPSIIIVKIGEEDRRAVCLLVAPLPAAQRS